jgi:hypothetical protein
MRLKGVDVPNKVNNGTVEICAMCGAITIAGIYEMRLTSEVYFLNQETSDFELNINPEDEQI